MTNATKFDMLLRILDVIRGEALDSKWEAQYACLSTSDEEIQQARSRAFIHLYLKVMFGLSEFAERESFITDGSGDGGIDGYYIDQDARRIYLIQSKFRRTERNFETKEIELNELLVMDIERITTGKTLDANGTPYNGKVQGLIRRISEISDIARYNYHVAILANCSLPPGQLRKLTDGYPPIVFNFARSYNELVFPIISGTFYRAHDVTVNLDLNNKSAGAKHSYSVSTSNYQCEITVLFVPTLEIAKAMDKYRNTILEYNPRSYLDFEGQHVNEAIRETLLRPDSNAFALMNNGITILSEETFLNERIGQENKAQLQLVRPQIINGGQTAYTLSRIFNEDKAGAPARFAGKEVLTKIITLTPKEPETDTSRERLELIDEISAASNRQTPVITADRYSNDSRYTKLQDLLFDRFGILLERKRGEFSDGVLLGYIRAAQVLERNLFLRIFLATQGQLNAARRKRIFVKHDLSVEQLTDHGNLSLFADGYRLFRYFAPRRLDRASRYQDILPKIYMGVMLTTPDADMRERIAKIRAMWVELVTKVAQQERRHQVHIQDTETKRVRAVFSPRKWIASDQLEPDVRAFVATGEIVARKYPPKVGAEGLSELLSLLDEDRIDPAESVHSVADLDGVSWPDRPAPQVAPRRKRRRPQ